MQNNQIMLWSIGLQSSSTQNFAGLKTMGHTTSQLALTLAEMLGDSYSKNTPLSSLPQYRDMSSRPRIIRRTDKHHSSPLTRLLNVQAAQLAALLLGN